MGEDDDVGAKLEALMGFSGAWVEILRGVSGDWKVWVKSLEHQSAGRYGMLFRGEGDTLRAAVAEAHEAAFDAMMTARGFEPLAGEGDK
jgi:hypothetical protein